MAFDTRPSSPKKVYTATVGRQAFYRQSSHRVLTVSRALFTFRRKDFDRYGPLPRRRVGRPVRTDQTHQPGAH